MGDVLVRKDDTLRRNLGEFEIMRESPLPLKQKVYPPFPCVRRRGNRMPVHVNERLDLGAKSHLLLSTQHTIVEVHCWAAARLE
jgi:hypothetical protein